MLQLVQARKAEDRFAIARISKKLSPILTAEALRFSEDKQKQLQKVTYAIEELMALWGNAADPTLLQILQYIAGNKLLTIPESLQPAAYGTKDVENSALDSNDDEFDRQSERGLAIEKFLNAPFSQVEQFATYMAGDAHFDTHQGVKGLEFDRVMVVMDDDEARGFTFKYEDLFGGKAAGNTTVENTRRLFYVTCSRAKQSLALVAYTNATDRVRNFFLEEGWFSTDEISIGIPR